MSRCLPNAALWFVFAAVMALAPPPRALAQSIEPMQGEVSSFSDRFAVQVYPGNPYNRPIKIVLRAYDADFRPISAIVHPQSALIGAKQKRRVIVIIPFEDKRQRMVRVCAESYPLPNLHARIRTQVCGRFTATRLG